MKIALVAVQNPITREVPMKAPSFKIRPLWKHTKTR
jgi:hypothetical protein